MHWVNVSAPYGHPNLLILLQFSHSGVKGMDYWSLYLYKMTLWEKSLVTGDVILLFSDHHINKYNYLYLCTKCRCLNIFLYLKFYFSSPYFSVDHFHVINSLLSHLSCLFLHPRILRSSFSSSSSSSSYSPGYTL